MRSIPSSSCRRAIAAMKIYPAIDPLRIQIAMARPGHRRRGHVVGADHVRDCLAEARALDVSRSWTRRAPGSCDASSPSRSSSPSPTRSDRACSCRAPRPSPRAPRSSTACTTTCPKRRSTSQAASTRRSPPRGVTTRVRRPPAGVFLRARDRRGAGARQRAATRRGRGAFGPPQAAPGLARRRAAASRRAPGGARSAAPS